MRMLLVAAACGLLGRAAAGQDPAIQAWIRAQFPDVQRATMQAVLEAARSQGLAPDREHVLAVKRALRVLRGKDRRGTPACQRIDFAAPRPWPAAAPGLDAAREFECNDGWQYADDMGGQTVAHGDCGGAGDVDCFRFTSTGAFYTFSVVATGAAPITDSTLRVRSVKGDPLAFDDNSNGLLSAIDIYLPPGTFYLEVGSVSGVGGGEYELHVQADPANVVGPGGGGFAGTTRAPAGGLAHDVFTFTVPECRADLRVSSSADTVLVLQRADGQIFFTDDDSSTGGLDAAADVDLPAGTYYACVSELNGAGGIPFTLSFNTAPITLPDAAAGPFSGVIAGDESLRLARVALAADQRIDATAGNGPSAPIGDTVMSLLDRDLDFVLDVDDDDPSNPARGFYSRIAVDLPAGTYFLGIAPFPGAAGDFTVATALSPYAPTGTARFGASAAAIAGFGQVNTYVLDNGSQTSARLLGDDFYFGVLDATGELASCQRGTPFFPQGGEVLAGRSTVFVYDRYDFQGPLQLRFEPALFLDGNGSVATHAKEGDLVFLLAEFGFLAPPFNFGVGDRGFLCLPQTPFLVTFAVQAAPASGVNVFWTPPPGVLVLNFQSVDVHTGATWPAPALATWRNVLQL